MNNKILFLFVNILNINKSSYFYIFYIIELIYHFEGRFTCYKKDLHEIRDLLEIIMYKNGLKLNIYI